MTKLFIVGIGGKMGQAVCKRASGLETFEVVGGLDVMPDMDFKVFMHAKDVNVDYDVIIDFSNPKCLDSIIELTKKNPRPVILATTGYDKKGLDKIGTLAKKVPVFMSGNMSWGIFVMQKLVSEAVKNLWDSFDVEIIEKHHNQKLDAPSGTAKMLADTICQTVGIDGGCPRTNDKPNLVYGREGMRAKRNPCDVTIHAVRGGTVVGEHEVNFYGNDEVITLSHTALSRTIFADGALRAAQFLTDKPCGLYHMKDMG